MTELIDRYATIDAIPAPTDADEAEYYGKICDAIEAMPTIEAEPVRHGQWIRRRNGEYYCTNCGREERYIFQKNYCQKCGSKMERGEDVGSKTD